MKGDGLNAILAAEARYHLHAGDWRDLAPELPSASIDHLITDPPYELEAHTRQRRARRQGVMVERPLPFPPIDDEGRAGVARDAARFVSRWVLLFCQVEAAHRWSSACVEVGLSYRRTMAWVKPDGAPQFSGDRPAAGYETIVCCHATGKSRWNGGGRRGVFVHSTTDMGRRAHLHPTQKPLPLMLELVALFTDPGDLVFDPFAGSGTTGVACLRLGRRFIGCELDPRFAELAQERLKAEARCISLPSARAGQTSIFDVLEGSHDEQCSRD